MKTIEINDLDEIDLKILHVLQFNAGIAKVNLAETVGLSPTPCSNRVKAMEARG